MIGDTAAIAKALINPSVFDPNTPGQPGAVAVSPYDPGGGGRAVLYVGEHQLIQALPFGTGVANAYDDITTYNWGGDSLFTIRGLLPGVEYKRA